MTPKLHLEMIVLLISSTCWAAWQPAEGPLTTPWTQDVSPEGVWPEYPRPQMVRPDWVNLNGLWDYAIVAREADRPQQWQGQILVPFAVESALSGVQKPVRPSERLWYRRDFQTPEMSPGQRLLLHFGAVDWQCTLWINGKEVGTHRGGYDPFSFDITDALKGRDNELVLAVWDPTDEGYQPRGKQVLKPGGIMYTAVTGIWQTVWLEVVPQTYVTSLKIVPDVDRSLVRITVHANTTARVQISGSEIETGQGRTGGVLEIPVPQAQLWSPDHPYLYDLTVTLLKQGRPVDRVDSYFGMRKIEVSPDEQGILRLKLNNEVLFHYGPLDQGWWPDGLYTPPTDEAIRYDIEMTKKFGMNMARKHVKVEPARWYYWCDKLGLMVWQDMVTGDAPRHDQSRANFNQELQAMIDALGHFPSIVMWVPFNEGWGQFETSCVVQWIQNYDPSRPVNEASGWHDRGSGDISDMHSYPGPGMRPVEESRAVVLGEFGGLGLPVAGHTWQAEENWGYVSYADSDALTDAYVALLTRMRPLIGQGLSAAVYTQTSDVEIEVNGLLTYDRKVTKLDLDRCAAAARKLYGPAPQVIPLLPTSEAQGQPWCYTLKRPDATWFTRDFDDRSWSQGVGGLGTHETPGTTVRTLWNSSDIWMRRSFNLDVIPSAGELALAIHHDEDAEVYLNGHLIQRVNGYVGSMQLVPLPAQAQSLLQKGDNLLAVHCHQTVGGQYIDVGLVWMQEVEVGSMK